MLLKIFRAVWFLSFLALFASLLFDYASWREELVVQEEANGQVALSRELLFYILLAVFALVNVLVYVVSRMFAADENFRAWFHGLIVTINIFFIVAMNFIAAYNGADRFDFSRVGFLVYGSVGLVICWAVAWPVYTLINKFFVKQVV